MWRAPGRAPGTYSVRTRPQRRQERRQISASSSNRHAAQVEVAPAPDRGVVGYPDLAPAGTGEPPEAPLEGHDHAGGCKLDPDHRGHLDGQYRVECRTAAHVSPLFGDGSVVSNPLNLPGGGTCASFACRFEG